MNGHPNEIDISVIIPCYNVGSFLREALQSVVKQTPTFREIIVVDDGSTDNTRDVVQSFKHHDIRYHYKTNQGLGPARNTGVSLSTSKYIYFLDGDDVLDEAFTRIVGGILSADASPGIVAFSGSDFAGSVDNTLPSSRHLSWGEHGSFCNGREVLRSKLADQTSNLPVVAWLYIFNRALLREPELSFLPIIHEDIPFTPQLFVKCNSNVVIVDEVLYHRRIRAGSISRTLPGKKNVYGFLTAASVWLNLARDSTVDDYALFLPQAYRFYAQALRYAAKARLKFGDVRALVAEVCPYFLASLSFDYGFMRVYRRLASKAIKSRGMQQAQAQGAAASPRRDVEG